MTAFPATRAAGLRRLAEFLPNAGRAYAEGRNADAGPANPSSAERSNVSVLSPYLRYRLLTEPEVAAAALQQHGPFAAAKFVQEVAWRTYWKGWLELRPAAWTRFTADRDRARDAGSELQKAVAQAEAGATGIEGFDDWARELVNHGYLHNHARMWFASIWIFTLQLPWTLGADFFLRHLVDADPASNTLSWRWVAGLQTRGKTYLATADNIARYTGGRFKPANLARRAIPLIEPPLPAPRKLPPAAAGPNQPALLLVTPEDFCPERMFLGAAPIRGALVVRGTESWPWGGKAAAFVAGAAADAASRLRDALDCSVTIADAIEPAAVLATAQQAGAQAVVTAYAPVGPVADVLDRLAASLSEAGLPLIRIRRDWDERLWPHATKGFFAFKEHLAAAMGQGGLPA